MLATSAALRARRRPVHGVPRRESYPRGDHRSVNGSLERTVRTAEPAKDAAQAIAPRAMTVKSTRKKLHVADPDTADPHLLPWLPAAVLFECVVEPANGHLAAADAKFALQVRR